MKRLGRAASAVRRAGLAALSALVTPRLEEFPVRSFERACDEAKTLYTELPKMSEAGVSSFEHPAWRNFHHILERYLLSGRFNRSFLRHPIIQRTMFARAGGHWQREELRFLRSVRPVPVLKRLLLENQLGAPYITSLSMLSSHNTIHHLYHLLRYEHVMKQPLSAIRSVVEFGGGYGNLARLASKLDMGGTYTIIDLPILSCIQLIYLSTILGRERIHVVSEDRDIAPQRVNLVPLPHIGGLRSLTCELFISTWALSECTESAQRYVTDRQFFSARRLLLAYQVENEIFGSPEHCVSESSKLFRVFREKIAFMPEAYYLFA